LAFVAVEGVALGWWLHRAHDATFLTDEWYFLSRRGWDLHELLGPYNRHWVLLPALAYRGLYALFGIRSYLPYQAVTITLHLTAAALLRTVMRRAGVGPWIATVAAGSFALLGAAAENVLGAWQMTFTGALVLGLVHLLLADHDGPIDWRDWVGLTAGLAGLMCSGVGVAMVAAVGVATLIRRGWRIAALHVVPLTLVFGIWMLGTRHWARYQLGEAPFDLRQSAEFVQTALGATFGSVGQLPLLAWVLGLVLVGGAVVAWFQTSPAERRKRFGSAAGLLVGMLLFIAITGVGRAGNETGLEWARKSRYVGVQAAMLLPAIAIGAAALARRWRVLGPAVLLVFIAAVPGSIAAADDWLGTTAGIKANHRIVQALAHNPNARHAPASMEVTFPWAIEAGWLADGGRSGDIPAPDEVSRYAESIGNLAFALRQDPAPVRGPCRVLRSRVRFTLRRGQSFGIRRGRVGIYESRPPNGLAAGVVFGTSNATPEFAHRLTAISRPLVLSVYPIKGAPRICGV
jgi:hypothetical protein